MLIPTSCAHPRQSGLALFIALALLLIITIVGLASVKSGLMEAQMAVNEEMRANTFETTQSTVDALVSNPANTQVFGAVGRRVCTANWTPPAGCEPTFITLPSILTGALMTGNTLSANVERMAPLLAPPPRGLGGGYSIEKYKVANFRITGNHEGTASGFGNARIVQGSLVLVPIATQTN